MINKKKNLTLIIAFLLVVTAFGFALKSNYAADFLSNRARVSFNNNFKNYNRILNIFDENGNQIAKFKTALADTDEKKRYGLMNLKELPQDHAMAFTFFPSQLVSMWMKNTFLELDMIFIDADNEIATIKHRATPHSLDIISSEREVVMVLEINGGLCELLGIKVGQKIQFLNKDK